MPAIWTHLGARADDVQAWQEALHVDPQTLGLPSHYYLFALSRIKYASNEAEAEHLIDIYRTAFPKRSALRYQLASTFLNSVQGGIASYFGCLGYAKRLMHLEKAKQRPDNYPFQSFSE